MENEQRQIEHSRIEQEKRELKLEISNSELMKYDLFKEKINPKSDIIYYPCSSTDATISKAFPDSRIIYVDLDQDAIETLQKNGLEAYNTSALEYNPGKIDILVLLNPTITPKIPSSFLNEKGYLLCNNYHNTASTLNQDEQFELKAVIRQDKKENPTFDTEKLDDYFKEIETEEEFETSSNNNFSNVSYYLASKIVKAITGKTENILFEYKKILEIAKTEELKKNPNSTEKDFFIFDQQEKNFTLNAKLPRKKGDTDSLFIFQKKPADKK